MPDVWHTTLRAGTAESERLLDAYVHEGGIVLVCGEWYELFDLHADMGADGLAESWRWCLVRRAAGAA